MPSSLAVTEDFDLAPGLNSPPDLPITQFREEIIAAIAASPVVIIAGEPGSGKTTQIPKFCLLAGRGRQKKIGCTQPRRIAAISMATRLGEELGQGGQGEQGLVGYRIRFSDRTGRTTRIKFMTDGILLAEVQRDRKLLDYDTIIVDEAHERSLNIDFLLGILKDLLPRRPDLKLVITSATIDTEKFSRHFDQAPVIRVTGRAHAVEVRYREPLENRDLMPEELVELEGGEPGYVEQAVAAVLELEQQEAPGDILIFMPTERDIRETAESLEQYLVGSQKNRKNKPVPLLPGRLVIMPLYGRLSPTEQRRIFQPVKGRKIVIATNVAETSITIPGIRYVIDTGLARIAVYNPRARTHKLPVAPIARSACDQRAGRCGRVGPGICIRLYSEKNYLNRTLYTPPEIVRSNLAEVILRMTALQLGHPAVFPFVDPPSGRAIKDGYQLLAELGALEGVEAKGQEDVGCPDVVASPAAGPGDEQKIFPARLPMARQAKNSPTSRISNKLRLSPQGRLMARLPLDPRIARMILAARDHNALREACIIAAALSVQDPRQRPAGREKEADKAHQSFAVRQSDFLFYLKLWDTLHAVLAQTGSQGKIRKFCAGHFLSYQRLREWQDVHEQILRILADERGFTFNTKAAEDAAIHQALLSGNLRNIALKKEKNIYQSGGGREVTIFPGSTLYHRNFPTLQPQRGTEAVKGRGKTVPSGSPQWIMAAELVETDRLYARTVAAIAPEWLEPLARPLMLMRYSHHDPHWEKGRGQVVAWEKGTLFGLVVVAGRKVAYARIDQEEARRIFLQSALVAGELRGSYPFLEHNRECVARLQNLEERSRRRDLLVDEHTIFDFYDQRLGPEVYDQASLNHLLKTRRGDDFLQMSEQDLSVREPEADLGEKFPTALEIGEISLKLTYCFKPGAEDDGLSVLIPAHLAADLRPELFEWLVPGMLPEKILFLLKNLPKNLRRHLVPIPQTAAAVTAALTCPGQPGNTALYQALSRAIYEMFGLRIDRDAWPLADLPPHLRCRFCLLDEEGKVLTAGRNLSALVRRKPTEAGILPTAAVAALRKQWELKGIAPAELPKIPARLPLLGTDGLLCGYLFPGLEESDDQVNLRLFTSEVAARAATRNGLLRLYRQTFASRLKVLRKDLLFPRQHWRLAQGFGTLEQLSQAISTFILRQIFDVGEGRLISAAQFIATTEQVDWPGLYIEARRLFALVLAVLSQRFEVLNALTRLQQLNQAPTLSPALSPTLSPAVLDKANPRMNPAKAQGRRPGPADKNSALVAELCGQLKALVPPDFLDHCTASSLARLPVYIKALEIRSQRAQVAPAKDATKAAQLKPYQDRLQKNYPTAAALFGELPGRLSEQKKARLTEYRLMLEEYKISLFAQELKTLFPVSPQRLDEKWREVEEEAFQGYSILVHKEGDFL